MSHLIDTEFKVKVTLFICGAVGLLAFILYLITKIADLPSTHQEVEEIARFGKILKDDDQSLRRNSSPRESENLLDSKKFQPKSNLPSSASAASNQSG